MRRSKGSVLVALAIAGTISALAYPICYSYPHRNDAVSAAVLTGETVNTQWGPLTPADRDLMVRVRLAGLWELPAGQQALERATSPAMKEAANHLIVGHADLDERVRIIAGKLGVTLPNQPNADQRGWLDQMTAAKGEEYNKMWANLLRSAHGKIFPAIAAVRNTTRNTLVRQLASDANQTVLDHITVLERTGEIDFEEIANNSVTGTASPTGPPPPVPGQAAPTPPAVEPLTNPDLRSKPSPTTPDLIPTGRPSPEELIDDQGEPLVAVQ
jgi:putative membrane protein